MFHRFIDQRDPNVSGGLSGSIQVVRPFSSVTAVAMEAVHLNVILNLIEETDDDIFEEIDNIRFMRFLE